MSGHYVNIRFSKGSQKAELWSAHLVISSPKSTLLDNFKRGIRFSFQDLRILGIFHHLNWTELQVCFNKTGTFVKEDTD